MRNGREKALHAGLACVAAVILAFALGGCAGTGAAAGGRILGMIQQKAAARAEWASEHRRLGEYAVSIYRDAAGQARVAGDLDRAIELVREAMAFHDTLRPEFLIKTVLDRAAKK